MPRKARTFAAVAVIDAAVCLLALAQVAAASPPLRGAATPNKSLPERIRGANSEIGVNDQFVATGELARWAKWGVNVVRAQLNADATGGAKPGAALGIDGPAPTADDPTPPYADALRKLDALVAQARAADVKVIVSVNRVWGRRATQYWDPVAGRQFRDHVVTLWSHLARRYRDHPTVVGYDVYNEPDGPARDWQSYYGELLPRSIRAIRAVDRTAWLVVQPRLAPGASSLHELPMATPELRDRRMIFSFHFYEPHRFTHQGVAPVAPRGPTYPGCFQDAPGRRCFQKDPDPTNPAVASLRSLMTPAVEFQARHRVRIYVGEFGVARWAAGGARYLADVVALLEERGWDWTFHSLSNWNGWNPTCAADDPLGITGCGRDGALRPATDRMQVLLDSWAKNASPAAPRHLPEPRGPLPGRSDRDVLRSPVSPPAPNRPTPPRRPPGAPPEQPRRGLLGNVLDRQREVVERLTENLRRVVPGEMK